MAIILHAARDVACNVLSHNASDEVFCILFAHIAFCRSTIKTQLFAPVPATLNTHANHYPKGSPEEHQVLFMF